MFSTVAKSKFRESDNSGLPEIQPLEWQVNSFLGINLNSLRVPYLSCFLEQRKKENDEHFFTQYMQLIAAQKGPVLAMLLRSSLAPRLVSWWRSRTTCFTYCSAASVLVRGTSPQYRADIWRNVTFKLIRCIDSGREIVPYHPIRSRQARLQSWREK